MGVRLSFSITPSSFSLSSLLFQKPFSCRSRSLSTVDSRHRLPVDLLLQPVSHFASRVFPYSLETLDFRPNRDSTSFQNQNPRARQLLSLAGENCSLRPFNVLKKLVSIRNS